VQGPFGSAPSRVLLPQPLEVLAEPGVGGDCFGGDRLGRMLAPQVAAYEALGSTAQDPGQAPRADIEPARRRQINDDPQLHGRHYALPASKLDMRR